MRKSVLVLVASLTPWLVIGIRCHVDSACDDFCYNKKCGVNPCGKRCGECTAGESCDSGSCVPHGQVSWIEFAGGSESARDGHGVSSGDDGAVMLTGAFSMKTIFGLGQENEMTLEATTGIGIFDAFVARYSADGRLQWVRKLGEEKNDRGLAIKELTDGAALVTGLLSPSAIPGQMFLAKYGVAGERQWLITATSPDVSGDSIGHSLDVGADGSIVVTGSFSGKVVFALGEPNETTLDSPLDSNGLPATDVFVAKYFPDGRLAWASRAGGQVPQRPGDLRDDSGDGVSAIEDGGFLVVGYVRGPAVFGQGEIHETVVDGPGAFVARFNGDGTLGWARLIGRCINARIATIKKADDSSAIVTGGFSGTVVFGAGEPNEMTLTSPGPENYALFVARYNADGSLSWARSAAESAVGYLGDSSAAADVSTLPDGGLIVAGRFRGTVTLGSGELNETSLSSETGEISLVAAYNVDGTLEWARTIRTGRAGDVLLVNGISGFLDGSSFITGTRGPDVFLARLEP